MLWESGPEFEYGFHAGELDRIDASVARPQWRLELGDAVYTLDTLRECEDHPDKRVAFVEQVLASSRWQESSECFVALFQRGYFRTLLALVTCPDYFMGGFNSFWFTLHYAIKRVSRYPVWLADRKPDISEDCLAVIASMLGHLRTDDGSFVKRLLSYFPLDDGKLASSSDPLYPKVMAVLSDSRGVRIAAFLLDRILMGESCICTAIRTLNPVVVKMVLEATLPIEEELSKISGYDIVFRFKPIPFTITMMYRSLAVILDNVETDAMVVDSILSVLTNAMQILTMLGYGSTTGQIESILLSATVGYAADLLLNAIGCQEKSQGAEDFISASSIMSDGMLVKLNSLLSEIVELRQKETENLTGLVGVVKRLRSVAIFALCQTKIINFVRWDQLLQCIMPYDASEVLNLITRHHPEALELLTIGVLEQSLTTTRIETGGLWGIGEFFRSLASIHDSIFEVGQSSHPVLTSWCWGSSLLRSNFHQRGVIGCEQELIDNMSLPLPLDGCFDLGGEWRKTFYTGVQSSFGKDKEEFYARGIYTKRVRRYVLAKSSIPNVLDILVHTENVKVIGALIACLGSRLAPAFDLQNAEYRRMTVAIARQGGGVSIMKTVLCANPASVLAAIRVINSASELYDSLVREIIDTYTTQFEIYYKDFMRDLELVSEGTRELMLEALDRDWQACSNYRDILDYVYKQGSLRGVTALVVADNLDIVKDRDAVTGLTVLQRYQRLYGGYCKLLRSGEEGIWLDLVHLMLAVYAPAEYPYNTRLSDDILALSYRLAELADSEAMQQFDGKIYQNCLELVRRDYLVHSFVGWTSLWPEIEQRQTAGGGLVHWLKCLAMDEGRFVEMWPIRGQVAEFYGKVLSWLFKSLPGITIFPPKDGVKALENSVVSLNMTVFQALMETTKWNLSDEYKLDLTPIADLLVLRRDLISEILTRLSWRLDINDYNDVQLAGFLYLLSNAPRFVKISPAMTGPWSTNDFVYLTNLFISAGVDMVSGIGVEEVTHPNAFGVRLNAPICRALPMAVLLYGKLTSPEPLSMSVDGYRYYPKSDDDAICLSMVETLVMNPTILDGVNNSLEVEVGAKVVAFTSLMIAAYNDSTQVAQLLLQSKHLDVSIRNRLGQTALEIAIMRHNVEIAKQIARVGILQSAKQQRWEEVRQILTEESLRGLDVNLVDDDGRTVLMLAVKDKQLEVITAILACCTVDLTIAARDGSTVLTILDGTTSFGKKLVKLLNCHIEGTLQRWLADFEKGVLQEISSDGASVDGERYVSQALDNLIEFMKQISVYHLALCPAADKFVDRMMTRGLPSSKRKLPDLLWASIRLEDPQTGMRIEGMEDGYPHDKHELADAAVEKCLRLSNELVDVDWHEYVLKLTEGLIQRAVADGRRISPKLVEQLQEAQKANKASQCIVM